MGLTDTKAKFDSESGISELSWICQECGQAHYDRDTKRCVNCDIMRYRSLSQITKGENSNET